MLSTEPTRAVSFDATSDGTLRYKTKKGRAVTKAERGTYERARAAMHAGLICSWHIYDDGWTFTVGDLETAAMTLTGAKAFLDALEKTTVVRQAA